MSMINCSFIIQDLFYQGIPVDKTDTLLAAQYFCDHILNSNILNDAANSSTFKEDFHQVCCNHTLVAQLCQEVVDIYLNKTLNLNCSNLMTQDTKQMFQMQVAKDNYVLCTIVAMVIFIPLGIISNLLILYAILRTKCLPIQTSYFLGSLAFADLGVILEFIAFFIYHSNGSDVPDRVHNFLIPSLDIFFASVSLLQITFISAERAIAVTWPLKYPSLISAKRAKCAVQAIWIFSAIQAVLALLRIPITANSYSAFVFYAAIIILLLIPLTAVTVSYMFVIVSAYQNITQERQRIKLLAVIFRSNDFSVDCNEIGSSNKSSAVWKLNTIRCKEIKLSMNVALVVLPFLGGWGFFVFAHMYEFFTNYKFEGLTNWFIIILPFGVSCINPVIYLVFTRSLRQAVKLMLCRRMLRSKLSRTELSIVTINTNNSRRTSSITGRKVGGDFSCLAKNDIVEEEEEESELVVKF